MNEVKHPGLAATLTEAITSYLEGKTPGPQVAAWALKTLAEKEFGPEEVLLEEALVALATLHDQDERWDTAREDLEELLKGLQGLSEHRHALEVTFRGE